MNTLEEILEKYEVVIGLEVHAQLKSKSKIFCPDSTEFGAEQNTHVCPITLGMPGVLPVLNRKVVDMAILTGLALNCEIAEYSKFDRKQYFYPDLPKGYQISQYDLPVCKNGYLMINGKKIGITRAHLEEDAGKLVHAGGIGGGLDGSAYSLVDLNRAGTPLLEIVSEPDIRSADEAKAYMEELRNIVKYMGVCDGNLEEGSMRCDANISIRPFGQKEFGTRAEIKNINSFSALKRAIEFEIERQAEILEEGGEVIQETRLWNDADGETKSMRSKEDAHDYRYFPEPDLMALEISRDWVEKIKATMPELPSEKRERYITKEGLSEYDAQVIVEQMETALFFDRVLELGANAKLAVNWLMGDITGYLKEKHLLVTDTKLTPENLAEMISMIEKGTISNKIAKDIIVEMLETGAKANDIVAKKGLSVISDEGELFAIVEKIIKDNPIQVAAYKSGKDKLFGFFVGQAMKATQGRANPQLINDIIKKKLAE
ncbi:MAG: Asp-tRNA(Asn)/Glu-tRNA(Gln) amidotransferase subunit GatB [Candidatus Gastranaerophilales bacterium]|nr:Asp-tRNA(Asn)/Glu-tRNA(Gln) amidotransferase subunit GatB [Candidatus Gastranaerophilales bacterium]